MMLSVCIITYNHERYIAESLDGVLKQRVRFPFEIVVGEDCSTDRTLEILREYAAKHPNLIRVLTTEKNLGAMPNFLRTYVECKGKYHAFLEGDDYWTDPDKLQRQVDFLESHPDYAICGHRVEMIDDTGAVSGRFPGGDRTDFTVEDLCLKNSIPSCSAVNRAGLVGPLGSWFKDCANGDWPFHVMHALHGRIHIFPEIMARYRIHAGGIWSSLTAVQRLERGIKTFWLMRRNLFHDKRSRLDLGIFLHWGYLILCLTARGQVGRAISELVRFLTNRELRWIVAPSVALGLGFVLITGWGIWKLFAG